MLVLSRKIGERIQIGQNIILTLNRVRGNRATFGIEAPSDVRIVRGELANLEESDGIRPIRIRGNGTTPPDLSAGAETGT